MGNLGSDALGQFRKATVNIVEWTGEEDSDASLFGSTKFLYKVKKGNNTFWMIQENLEKYKVQVADRPSSISNFISKYNISSSMTDQES